MNKIDNILNLIDGKVRELYISNKINIDEMYKITRYLYDIKREIKES